MTISFKFWRYAVRLCTYCGRDWSNTPGSFVGCQPNCAARHKRLVNLLTSSLGYLTEVCIHVFAQNLDNDTENDCRGTVVLQHLHTQSQVPVVRLTSLLCETWNVKRFTFLSFLLSSLDVPIHVSLWSVCVLGIYGCYGNHTKKRTKEVLF